ncbi:DoxX family protein [Litorihabitans aurantiacus]|uniref:DoxX family protein n=1 Tax=Litorihabitans aurantiacus TaxID=1930061 RepID=A0AA37XCU1_9MICO|nr:DoxX family protein [Litorihabitans aurantiacus]GMA30661.1 hypothetical protein GCM10025875_06530 [Litorihabitans aurantiacus]
MLIRRVARPLLASVFVADGWRALRHPAQEIEHLPGARKQLTVLAERAPVPLSADVVVRAAGATKIVAGVLLGLGVAPRAAATVLTVLHVPTLAAAHPFWETKGETRREHVAGLVRDGAVLGGLLLAAADTAGKPSLGWRLDAARTTTAKKATTHARHARRTAKVAKVAAKQAAARVPDKAKLALHEVTDRV